MRWRLVHRVRALEEEVHSIKAGRGDELAGLETALQVKDDELVSSSAMPSSHRGAHAIAGAPRRRARRGGSRLQVHHRRPGEQARRDRRRSPGLVRPPHTPPPKTSPRLRRSAPQAADESTQRRLEELQRLAERHAHEAQELGTAAARLEERLREAQEERARMIEAMGTQSEQHSGELARQRAEAEERCVCERGAVGPAVRPSGACFCCC
jgi:hypothetical protein